MYSLNRMGSGLGPPQQTRRQFSTGPENTSFFKTMPPASEFLNKINLENISSQKRFANPNYVNNHNTNIHSCPKNLKLNSQQQQLTEVCSGFAMAPTNFSLPPVVNSHILFNTEMKRKEDTQRRGEYRSKNHRDHTHSSRKSHKNKMNIDLKYEIDEVGVDVLSDAFESDSNPNTPTVDMQIPPVFIHEAKPETYKITSAPICITIETPEKMPTVLLSINTETRTRLPSECGSEDSFIVFQCSTEDDNDDEDDILNDDDESDSDSVDDTEEESSTEYSEDDLIDEKFEGLDYKTKSKNNKKVTFANDLCKVHLMIKWSYAYQAARKGPWEEYARDRCRFKDRIARVERVVGPVLQVDHRQKVYKERYL